jgi:transposase InsO family protein
MAQKVRASSQCFPLIVTATCRLWPRQCQINLSEETTNSSPLQIGTAYDLSRPDQPNDLWCADYKGEFMLADHRYCYPLTITDFASRYLLCCEGLQSTREHFALSVFERTFKDYGLPRAIRSDNGVPFASTSAFFGLSKLDTAPFPGRFGAAVDSREPTSLRRVETSGVNSVTRLRRRLAGRTNLTRSATMVAGVIL